MTTKLFKIGNVKLSDKKCVLIAEAGVNHNCNLKLAEKFIKAAKKNCADIIKFQTYKAETLTIKIRQDFGIGMVKQKKMGL